MNQALTDGVDQFAGAGAAMEASADASQGDSVSAGTADRQIYAGREWTPDHPLNIRISVPIGFGRYYVTLVAGKERRARARLAIDRRQHPLDTPANTLFLAFIVTIATAGSIALAYLLMAHTFGWSGRLIL